MRAHQTKRVTAAAAVTAVVVAIGSLTLIGGTTAQADIGLPGDGSTSTTAGASCWGIKQAHPASEDGTYWLNTAQLERPQEFHCDMTTDGGGWVLLGRGREGWTFNPLGQGSPQTVRETVDGPGAFGPAALDTGTIEGLLGDYGVDELPDGIRLSRATNSSGSTRQDYRLFPQDQDWSWSFPDGKLLDRVVVDGQTYNGSNTWDTRDSVPGQVTNDLAGLEGTLRMWTWEWSGHDDLSGFSFGSGVSGASSDSSSHLWHKSSRRGRPIPFTQVWVRPQIANDAAGFSPLPAEGFAAETKPGTLNNRSEVAPWGVVGLNHTGETRIEPWNTNVLSLHVEGDRTFVGGRFTGVQNGPNGTEISQPWLAAFDLDGNWIDTFRPQLDGRVWDMITTPDGKLVIAGDFDQVNGTPGTAGMAKIDPVTGAVDTSFKADFDRTSGDMIVRTLDQSGGYIYASGSFNRLTAANWGQITVSHNINLRDTDGRPGGWRPRASGHVVDIDVTDDGSRVLMGGFFNRINDDYDHGYNAITDAATGNPIDVGDWEPAHTSAKYQQAVQDMGDGRIFTGGSQHNIHLWDWDRNNLLDAAVTKSGGDTQAVEIVGDKTYVGCHCGDYVYEGTNDYGDPSDARKVSPINLVGAWDTETWTYDTEWYPSSLKGDRGEGIWDIDSDSRGCLWVGGDLNRGSYSGNAETDWLGGFARFCSEDSAPPTAPTELTATVSGSGVELTWAASTDDSGSVFYDIYRDDRVIATTFGTSYTDPEIEGASHLYTVRAADPSGNRSASPAPIAVNGPSPVIGEVLAFGSTWRYADDGADQGTTWRDAAFDDTGWGAGAAKIGWGRWDVVTTVGPNKPNTLYLRSTFEIDDPAQVRLLDLQASVATGAVIYVNGVEAGRIHMPDGEVTASTPASGYIWGEEERRLKSVSVPADLLVAGTNSVAVEVHNMTAGGSRLFFDMQGTAYASNGDNSPPTAPALTATPNGTGNVDLTWTASSDDEAIGGYVVRRDGQPIATRGPAATSFSDLSVDTAVPHTYTVSAFDMNGNATASNTVTLDPVVDPNLLGYGATWQYFYLEGGPTGPWADPTFDDTTWGTGAAEFGFGEGDEATVISTDPTPRPATAYFRTTVDIDDPAAFGSVLANVVRDDGVALYVNGVEVGRDNLPAGPLTSDTLASQLFWTNADERTPVPFAIPASAFQPGTNTIAVEVHNGDRWSGDLSFDLELVGQP